MFASNDSMAIGATRLFALSYGPPKRNSVRFVCSLAGAIPVVEMLEPLGMMRAACVYVVFA